MERLSIAETRNIADLYQQIIDENMDCGGLLGGVPSLGGELTNSDNYAPGDTRKPYLFGSGVQSRKGIVKRRKNKKLKKSKIKI